MNKLLTYLQSILLTEVSSATSMPAAFSDPEEFLPKLVETLTDTDQFVVDECLLQIDRGFRKQKFALTVIRSEQLMRALMETFNKSVHSLIEAQNNWQMVRTVF